MSGSLGCAVINEYVQAEMKDVLLVIVIGAGTGGLTAAYSPPWRKARGVTVLEADPDYVWGISRTVH